MESMKDYMREIKKGNIRGDYKVFQVTHNVYVGISVADFQFGDIHIRAYVESERDVEENLYMKQLYREDDAFKKAHHRLKQAVEDVREVDTYHAYELQIRNNNPREIAEDIEVVSNNMNLDKILVFDDHVRLRDDVTLAEAMMTNKKDEEDRMSRSEVEDFLED
jgi:hypothetical protein